MVLDGVKESFESQKEIGFYSNHSSFILCTCDKNNKNKYILNEIIPLENKLCRIKIDRNKTLLTDTEGNILINFDDFKDTSCIEYVNENDLLISNYILINPNYVFKRHYQRLDHYHYDKELEKVTTLYNDKDGKLENFELINGDTMLIETSSLFQKSFRLYSLNKKEYISPVFKNLEAVPKTNDTIFKFTDKISSSLEVNGLRYSSNIIGFITIDGKFYNGVYDQLSNKEIECELNSKPDFEEYMAIKKMIQGKLNEKVVKESNKQITKDFIIKKLENKAKKEYNK